ncbi:MAG: acetylglutamate kinase [Chloroflexi bacterium]|nr:acetylglutamate kinase [Ardenticatenaceae bacterium]MBL1130535.1 acetylglutamate kinase [Chloroflexota bacterium]NOG36625.1 acetylglutamate kinase [Chloroflexota bacterium]GIK56726.1 MAG: acetylglutamate kinase [Chloroflexota bacterium]
MTQVIKVGGNELDDPAFLSGLALAVRQIQEMSGQTAVIVHGGGKAIADLQRRLGIAPQKVDGLRVTDADSLMVAEMVLSGLSNKVIVRALLAAGVTAVGLSGVDGGLLRCQKKQHPTADLGFVGEIEAVNVDLIQQLAERGFTAVISPISLGTDGRPYNVNADEAAAAVAKAVGADVLNLVSNVPGVLQNGTILPHLTITQTEALITTGVITDGMIPKVRAACTAVAQGIPQVRIVNLDGFLNGEGTVVSER